MSPRCHFSLRAKTVLISMMFLSFSGAAFAAEAAKAVTDETLHQMFENSKEMQTAHTVMSGERQKLQEMQNLFLVGDYEGVTRTSEEIADSMGEVMRAVPLTSEKESEAWHLMSAIVNEADAIHKLSAAKDYKKTYEHYTALVGNCIQCHQLVRDWGKLPEFPEKTEKAPVEAKDSLKQL